jgi:hypothetical protein
MYIKNPLDDFESYSVHYILLAARSTEIAQDFCTDDEKASVATLEAISNVKALGEAVQYKNNTSDVFLVMDTRRFSQFSVENLKYDVYINGLQKGTSSSNLAADLQMTILDSVGISFANFMQWLMDTQMQTNYDGLIFLLRTIFVGHESDGSTKTIQSETIPMHLNRMEINLDFAKGAYTLEFMPNMNFDVNRYSRFLTISTATTYRSKDNKLGSMIDSVQNSLNRASTEYFNKVQKIVSQNGAEQLGRKVEYMITIPEKWNNLLFSGSTIGNMSETKFEKNGEISQNASTSGTIKDSYASSNSGNQITKVLEDIFKQVPEIANFGNFKSTDSTIDSGSIRFYKFIVGLTSNVSSVCVHIDIVEFEIPNLFRRNSTNSISEHDKQFYIEITDEFGVVKRVPNDFIEFDYIFTGKNKDILNFDLKIQDFQFLLASNLRIGDSAMKGVVDNPTAPISGIVKTNTDELLYTRKFDPLILPLDSEAALTNFSKYTLAGSKNSKNNDLISKSQQYTRNLSMFYAGSPISAALTIKGNPLIMHKFNMGKLLNHPNGSKSSGSNGSLEKKKYREVLESNILKANDGSLKQQGSSFKLVTGLSERSYAISPVFARINIKGPNVDFRTNTQANDPTSEYSSSVLSDNYYVIFKVSNNINHGVFTQDLELYSHNIFGREKITKQ